MVLLMSGLETRVYRLPLAIGSRAQIVTSTVLGAPETFVERGVGSAFGRTGAFPAASIVLAQSAPLVRTIYVVREEFAVLAWRNRGRGGPLPRNTYTATCSCAPCTCLRCLPSTCVEINHVIVQIAARRQHCVDGVGVDIHRGKSSARIAALQRSPL